MMAKTPRPRLAIVVGGLVNGLGLVRGLTALNLRIVIITTTPYDIAQYSKYVFEHHHLSDINEQPECLAEMLQHRAKDWLGSIIFPTNDAAIASLSLYHGRLSKWYRIVVPPLDSTPYVLDKNRMLQAAAAVGILAPYCYGPAIDSTALQPDIRYPVIVKPVKASEFSSKFGRKLFLANTQQELMACTQLLAKTKIAGQVFDLIPGPDSQIYAYCVYMGNHCTPLAECTVRKLRQSPPSFGIARVAECVPHNSVLREQTIELLRYIGFRGIAVAEFKHDPRDGSFRFFEINGRSVVYNRLLQRGGMDVARLGWSDYVEGQAKPVKSVVWKGVWIHLHADILHSILNRHCEQVTIRDYLRPYCRPRTFAVWCADDPKPFFAQWFRTMREVAAAVYSRTFRETVGLSHSSNENR